MGGPHLTTEVTEGSLEKKKPKLITCIHRVKFDSVRVRVCVCVCVCVSVCVFVSTTLGRKFMNEKGV